MQFIDDKTASKNILAIKSNGAKLDQLIHSTGMYAIYHASMHGNTQPLNKLVSALNKSTRTEAFKVWVRDHSKVVEKKDGTFEYRKDRKLYDEQGKIIEIEQALELANVTPFFEYTKESKPVSQVDVLSRIESLIKLISQGEKTLVAGKHTLGGEEQSAIVSSLNAIKESIATE